MNRDTILVVDDEKNIRLSLAQALQPLGRPVVAALSGEEALGMLRDPRIGVMILDLRLPGMDGMAVLERASRQRPEVAVIMVTAYGGVERAVEAMKLGAADFITKPFSPEEIREAVARVAKREAMTEADAHDYRGRLELAKQAIRRRDFTAALDHARQAVGLDPYRAEGFNLAGALHEILHQREEALRNYRLAVEVDPSYPPAQTNLERLVSHRGRGGIVWDDDSQFKDR